MKFLKVNRFNQGILCNYVSLGILALSGFAFNIIILKYYDAAALGLFNQVYAWYVVLSQVASLGIHCFRGNRNYYARKYQNPGKSE